MKSKVFTDSQIARCVFAAAVVGFLMCSIFRGGSAYAAGQNLDTNLCDPMYNTIPPEAKYYAESGKIKSNFVPKHSRAWYATALGLTPTLDAMLKSHPLLLKNMDLLALAAGAPRSSAIATFLYFGADPNQYIRASFATGTLIMFAAQCQRPINMLYLINAGANMYEYYENGSAKVNAMGISAMGGALTGPYKQNIIVLLASGYDPRCPVTEGETALTIVMRLLAQYKQETADMRKIDPQGAKFGKNLEDVVSILKGAVRVKQRQSGLPNCGSSATKSGTDP